MVESARDAAAFGVAIPFFEPDFAAIVKRSRDVSKRVSMGVGYLFKKNKISLFKGTACFLDSHEIGVFDDSGAETARLAAARTILATGGRPRTVPGVAIDGKRVIGSREAMTLEKRPAALVVIGAGAIGMEFAWFYRSMGAEVSVVEMLDRVLPIEDAEVSRVVARTYKKKGIKILVNHMVSKVAAASGGGVTVTVKDAKKGGEKTLSGDAALMAIGVRGNVERLGLEEVGVETDRGFIVVGKGYRTSVEGIHAVGDVIGPPLLAHVASHEAVLCVEGIAGLDPEPFDYDAVPGCTFCKPQVGSIGLTEEEAEKRGHKVRVGKFSFAGTGKAVAAGERDGFVKLVVDGATGRLLGGHIVGPEAAELLGELELAMAAKLTDRAVASAVHSHPTLHEAIMEAALDSMGRAIHL